MALRLLGLSLSSSCYLQLLKMNEKNALAGRSLGLSCQTAFEVPEPRQHSTRVLTAQLAMDSLASNRLEFKPFKPGQALQASSTHGYSLVDDGTAWALWAGAHRVRTQLVMLSLLACHCCKFLPYLLLFGQRKPLPQPVDPTSEAHGRAKLPSA